MLINDGLIRAPALGYERNHLEDKMKALIRLSRWLKAAGFDKSSEEVMSLEEAGFDEEWLAEVGIDPEKEEKDILSPEEKEKPDLSATVYEDPKDRFASQ